MFRILRISEISHGHFSERFSPRSAPTMEALALRAHSLRAREGGRVRRSKSSPKSQAKVALNEVLQHGSSPTI